MEQGHAACERTRGASARYLAFMKTTPAPLHPALISLPFSLLVFLGAVLLFQVELMIARILLPSFGSAASVWTTCLVFYQGVLLLGYLYAERAAGWIRAGRYRWWHLLVVALPALVFPFRLIRPELPPVLSLFLALAVSVGLPFLALSMTSVVAQAWFTRTEHPHREDPYFLYAISNAGSLVGLLGYPFLVEPRLELGTQLLLWYLGYGLFVLLTLVCVSRVRGTASAEPEKMESSADTGPAPWSRRLSWLLLSAGASALLMAVTTITGMDASVPMLWVLPLTIYLLTLVVCFARKSPGRALMLGIQLGSLVLALVLLVCLARRIQVQLAYIGLFSLVLLIASLLCHTRLARSRPEKLSWLGSYYLYISLGGFLGALLLSVVAPILFRRVPTIAADFVLAGAVIVAAFLVGDLERIRALIRERPLARYAMVLFGLVVLGVVTLAFRAASTGYQYTCRTFYGLYRVCDTDGRRLLYHGNTLHGVQSLDPNLVNEPLAYYHRESPIGRLLEEHPRLQRVGIVGLGAGGLLVYARPDQDWDYFEIDPEVLHIAEQEFSFLPLSKARNLGMILGDARLSLEKLAPSTYDVLVMDTFSSDFIPTHLMTRQAIEMYLDRVKPQGLLVFHISNRLFDLRPVLSATARELGIPALISPGPESPTTWNLSEIKLPSLWLAMTRDPERLEALRAAGWSDLEPGLETEPWTDGRVDLLRSFKW